MARVIVGTADGLHAFDALGERSEEGPTAEFAGREVTALARDGSELWALLDGTSVHLTDGEAPWMEVGALHRWRGRCVLPTTAGVLVGTSEAHLLRLSDGTPMRIESFEQVEGRAEWHTPWGGPPDTRSMSVDEAGTIYVNVHVGGILRSPDGGASWRPTIDIDADVHQVLAHARSDRIVHAATAHGLATSHDGGSSWRFHTDGLHATYSRAVSVSGDVVLLSASEGPRGGRSAIYRAPAGRSPVFEKCRQGLPEWFDRNVDTGCLDSWGSTVAFGTADGSVFVSNDGGESWRTAATGLAPARSLVIV